MFDLNAQLKAWKQSFDDVEALRSADANELGQRVRDTVGELVAKGLTDDEAFAIAIRRAGDPRPLAASVAELAAKGLSQQEALAIAMRRAGDSRPLAPGFRTVGGGDVSSQRTFWMVVGYLTLQMVSMLAWVGQHLATSTGAGPNVLLGILIAIPATCWLAIAMIFQRSARDEQGGPLARLCEMPRWANLSLAAIIPVVAALSLWAGNVYLSSLKTQESFSEISKILHWSEPFVLVAIFILLFATAESLRRTAAKTSSA